MKSVVQDLIFSRIFLRVFRKCMSVTVLLSLSLCNVSVSGHACELLITKSQNLAFPQLFVLFPFLVGLINRFLCMDIYFSLNFSCSS